jgi:hypothetical protein
MRRRSQRDRATPVDSRPGAATAVSPFFCLMLVWALVIGYVVGGDVPTARLLVGSAIAVASCCCGTSRSAAEHEVGRPCREFPLKEKRT